ncbi:nucleoside-diphosphate sugar epimerase/dehydratase [Flavobacterium sp.]|uniref:polysaccharide biosynthesis protein n=1 Tax=Flavobacterium sp. TaxID=239 RepID=UPI0026305B88|nr:nucleoside-diphosphate sugar epimerase/dehydratase [Flavobacterium sp.]
MKKHFFDRLLSMQRLRDLSYLPRWIVLLLDMLIVLVSAAFTYIMLIKMERNYVHQAFLPVIVLGFLLLNLFFFWIFRTYSGIIRHSSFIDAVKLFIALFLTLVTLVVLNIFCDVVFGQKIFMNAGLFINFIFTFSGLLLYRIIVKQTFELYLSETKEGDLTKTVIFGADANALSVAAALRYEKPQRFRVVAFIDKEDSNSSKRIMNLPIISLNRKITTIMRSLDVEGLILADKGLTKDEKIAIVDECLDYNYKVFTMPAISDWEDKKEISKKIKSLQIQDLLERKPIVLDSEKIANQLAGKCVLITGAAGSIGSEITRQVLKFAPKKVILLDQAETPLHNLSLELRGIEGSDDIFCAIADVRDQKAMLRIFQSHQPDVVYHAAAYKHVPLMEGNPSQAIMVNVLGTKNVADLCVEFNIESMVMVSTDKAVNPSNVMGASKRIAEMYVQSLYNSIYQNSDRRKVRFITTRFGNVLGSNGSVVPLFTSQIEQGGPITITHPDIIRYFMTIPEACQLVLEAGAMGNGGEIFIFDMGKPVKIIDLARKMIRLAGYVPDEDIKIKIVGLRPGEKLYEELLNDGSKTLPTHHEKIMVASETTSDFEKLESHISELVNLSIFSERNEIVKKMKLIVPEFKSMNSEYKALD